jgi:hypothetical protein
VETSFLGPTAEFFEAAARGTAARGHVHGRWFKNDADHVIAEWPLSQGEARLNATYVALSGGVYLLGDDVRTLGRDRLNAVLNPELLALVREGGAATPLDLFEERSPRVGVEPFVAAVTGWAASQAYVAREVPTLWRLERPSGAIVLGVFNWSAQSARRTLPFQDLGLKPVSYLARDLWAGTRASVADPLTLDLPPRSVRLLELTPR